MKVLVFAYQLVVSGTTVNAIELTAALRDQHGFDVALFATPGPLLGLVEEKQLRLLPAPHGRFCPSHARMRALRDAVRSERPDVLYVWDWPQSVEAYFGVHLPMRVPMVVTDMSMSLMRLLPKGLPTTFGTPELVDNARAAGRRHVELLLPPVDVRLNAGWAVDPGLFRKRLQIGDNEVTVVTVSRLDNWMKGESLFRTLDAVRALGRELPVRFVIVGDGSVRAKLQEQADKINAEIGRTAVSLTGALVDPRPAYAAADIVIGMGGSALRGMAFAKPVIVVGEQGFAATFSPDTAESFYYKGLYGRGTGGADNEDLTAEIRALAECPDRRRELGQFSRRFVVRHFALERVSARLASICRTAASEAPSLGTAAVDGLRTAAVYFRERRFTWQSRPPALEPESGS
jgi:glycosyltransferase involved in cell wall biosynthesis